MKILNKKFHLGAITMLAGFSLATQQAHSAAIIYETFADSNSTLAGNTPGLGLSGTYTSNGALVETGSLSYGDLLTESGDGKATFSNQYMGISTGTTLTDAGLLADGEELWFSFLVRTGTDIATNGDLGFVLGTDRIGSGNNIPMTNSGTALGVRFKNNQLRAAEWGPTLSFSNGTGIDGNTLALVVGRFTWGAASDTIDLWTASEDLQTLTLASTRTTASNYNQANFNTISIGSKASGTDRHQFDEIRFGATQADVLVAIPEPSTTALIGLGGLALILRRRK